MCRLYGFSATDATRLDCSLVTAQNALQVQSDRDQRGQRNADGWGVVRWSGDDPDVIRSADPAFADPDFADQAASRRSNITLAHIRAATVGDVTLDNVHPFTHGPWAFAHNGTLTAHREIAPLLGLELHDDPKGTTDSELIFQWMLGRMPEFGLNPQAQADHPDRIAALLEDVIVDLVRWSIAIPGVAPPRLNFLLSDGSNMAASRWGNSLHWTMRTGFPDCAVCGTSHCPSTDESYRAIVIASEPITEEIWTEVQEGTVLSVGPGIELRTRDLLTKAA
jgi:predicted glutamine amidotransferase